MSRSHSGGLPVWWSAVLDCLEELILVTDLNGIVQYVNRAFQINLGYTAKELVGQTPDFFIEMPADPQSMKAAVQRMRQGDGVEFNLNVHSKQGQSIEASVFISAFCEKAGEVSHYLCVARDLSRERILHKQLHELQRMDAVGRLARGIADRFNRAFNTIDGQIELLNAKPQNDPFLLARVKGMLNGVDKGRELVNQLRTFVREQALHTTPVELGRLMRQFLLFYTPLLPSGVELKFAMPDENAYVMGISEEINQILLNLLNNAFEALPAEGGTIELSLKVVDEGLKTHTMKKLPSVRIRVKDSGGGIVLANEKQIFEPFFTTKQQQGALGMGLTVVKALVERYRGKLNFYSAPQQGAVFEVYLPLHISEEEADKDFFGPRGKGQRVLIVDDEPFILQSGEALLTSLGYQVTSAESLEILEKRLDSESVDVIVLDMTLEGENGLTGIKRLGQRYSLPPVILMTPLDMMPQPWETHASGIVRVLLKPCAARELNEAIHQLFSQTTP